MATPTVPDWITTEFFQSCLQAHEKQPLTVTNYTINQDIPEGNNYGSQILRATVEYTKENTNCSKSLIMKVPVALVEETLGEVYEKEMKFYKEFLNETYKYSKHDIVPEHYNSPNPRCVVLEDLKVYGYKMVDRHNFLDLEHCKLFIKAKAKLHALSMIIYKNNPEIIESVVKESPKFKENSDNMTKSFFEGGLNCMIAYLEDNSYNKEYLDIIKDTSKDNIMWQMIQEIEDSCSKKPLKALIQLDPWCTNMMFKYDSLGQVNGVKILDFQALAFTSPIKEIVTFMSLCPNMEVRKTKLNYLYKLYFDTLNGNLAELGCPERINFEEMKAEIYDMGPMVLFTIFTSVPILLAEGAADVNEYLSGNLTNAPIRESSVYKLYLSASWKNCYLQLLDVVASEGVFDYIKEKLKHMKPQ